VAGIYHLEAWAGWHRFPAISWEVMGIDTAVGRRRRRPMPRRSSTPHLILHGDRDTKTPLFDARRYDRRARRARLVVMRGAKHQQPARYVRPARRWLLRWARR